MNVWALTETQLRKEEYDAAVQTLRHTDAKEVWFDTCLLTRTSSETLLKHHTKNHQAVY